MRRRYEDLLECGKISFDMYALLCRILVTILKKPFGATKYFQMQVETTKLILVEVIFGVDRISRFSLMLRAIDKHYAIEFLMEGNGPLIVCTIRIC